MPSKAAETFTGQFEQTCMGWFHPAKDPNHLVGMRVYDTQVEFDRAVAPLVEAAKAINRTCICSTQLEYGIPCVYCALTEALRQFEVNDE